MKHETLPAAWYHDPEIFTLERERVFARHWTLVARMDQLSAPGDYIRAEVAGRPIFVILGRNGELRAFHNVCRHRAGPLVTADSGRCSVLRCRYHGWLYNLEGQLKKAPQFDEGDDFDRADFNLFPVSVATWNSLVFVTLAKDGPSLEAWLGEIVDIAKTFPPLADMSFHREDRLTGQANWKAYGDNSAEGYHVTHVHKDLGKAVESEEVIIKPYENGQFVGFDVTYRSPEYAGSRRAFWIYKFPGLLLHFSEQSFNLERVIPRSPGTIELVRWFWFSKTAELAREEKDEVAARSGAVMAEDLAICEAVQRNLEAGIYKIGRLSPNAECGTLYIQGLLREALALNQSGTTSG